MKPETFLVHTRLRDVEEKNGNKVERGIQHLSRLLPPLSSLPVFVDRNIFFPGLPFLQSLREVNHHHRIHLLPTIIESPLNSPTPQASTHKPTLQLPPSLPSPCITVRFTAFYSLLPSFPSSLIHLSQRAHITSPSPLPSSSTNQTTPHKTPPHPPS